MPFRWHRFPGRIQIIFLAIAALLATAELVNGRFWLNDFRVYYDAANALLNGEPLYGVPHGLSSGYFKYAPFMAMLYVPLALLPYSVAAGAQYVLIACAFSGAIITADRLVRTYVLGGKSESYAALFLTLLVVGAHLHRELHLGNINVLLLWLLLAALEQLLSDRRASAGILFGLAMLAKPHFLVLMPLLLLRGHTSAVRAAITTVAIGLVLPVLIVGPSAAWSMHAEWLGEMARHNASLFYTGGDAYNSVNTVYSMLHRVLLGHFLPEPGTVEALLILALIAAGFGTIVLLDRKREREHPGSQNHFVQEYFLLLALVPSITLTDTNHFLFSTPLVLLILHHLLPRAPWKWLGAASIAAFLAYGGNWGDALGPFSGILVHYGVLGAGNLMLVLLGCALLLWNGSATSPAAGPSHLARTPPGR